MIKNKVRIVTYMSIILPFSTSDSAIMMAETTKKPLVKLAALNTSSFNLGKTLKYQTPYEKLVNKIASEIPIELLDE